MTSGFRVASAAHIKVVMPLLSRSSNGILVNRHSLLKESPIVRVVVLKPELVKDLRDLPAVMDLVREKKVKGIAGYSFSEHSLGVHVFEDLTVSCSGEIREPPYQQSVYGFPFLSERK